MIWIANILLTRRCNLYCDYCNIVKDYDHLPVKYNKVEFFHNRELTGEQWMDIISRLTANNPDVFLILYGGEPTMYKDLYKVVKYCNDYGVAYTIISNNTKFARRKIYEIYEELGTYRGFTSSVDPLALMDDADIPEQMSDMVKKSRLGLENLVTMKRDGIAEDVVAEITIMRQSLFYLYPLVKQLSDNGVFSSITAVDDQKTKWYDFSNVTDSKYMLEPSDEVREIFNSIQVGAESGELKVHIPWLLDDLFNILPSKMKCTLNQDVHNVTIEPDGTFRLCLRIRGTEALKLPYYEAISTDGTMSSNLAARITNDYDLYCRGCNWTCPIMSGVYPEKVISHV